MPNGIINVIRRPAFERRLEERVASSEGGLTLLVGPRGCGKTTLLRQLEKRFSRRQPCSLVQIEPITASPEILAEAVGRLASVCWSSSNGPSTGFDDLLRRLRHRSAECLLLLDELTELRTLSHFPGLDKPLEAFIEALLGAGKARTVGTSRFPFWLRGQSAKVFGRTALIDIPPVTAGELEAQGSSGDVEQLITVTGGLMLSLSILREYGLPLEMALRRELAYGGRLETECRAGFADLLHRARGYGACKAVLKILAQQEGLSLSEVARRLGRTPGSTRDYLRWLEEVELVSSRDKRYRFVDPLLRLWLRIYGSGRFPDESRITGEVGIFLETPPLTVSMEPREKLHRDVGFTLPPLPKSDFVEFD